MKKKLKAIFIFLFLLATLFFLFPNRPKFSEISQTRISSLTHSQIEIKRELPANLLATDRAKVEAWINSLPPTQSSLWLVHLPTSPLFRSVLEERFDIQFYQDMNKFEVFKLQAKS